MNMSNNKKESAKTFGKIVKLPKNSDVTKAIAYMENIKIPHDKHWYILTEKEMDNEGNQLHLVKYNKEGVDANQFVSQLKLSYINYTTYENMKQMFSSIKVVGNEKFSVIRNIPNIEIIEFVTENGNQVEIKKTLVSKITSDLIKLLRN